MTVTTIDHSEREELRELWHEAINGTVALAANLAEAHEEITKLRERCEAYKGQVESGAAEIERLRAALGHISRMHLLPNDKDNRATLVAARTIARDAVEQAIDKSEG
jgi:cob(I)alamin adenosyltransferase